MEDAIRDMHGRELGDRSISVNKAQPKMGGEEPGHGYGSYSSGGRPGGYGGGDRSAGPDDCFKCGRPGHWARDCPSAGGGRGARPFSPPRSKYGGGPGSRADRYADDRDRYLDDRGRYGDRDRYDGRDDRYGSSRDRYVDRYPPPAGDRIPVDRYGVSDRYGQNGYGKDRAYVRDGGPRGAGDRYGGGGPPARYEGRSYRERPGPYDRPRRGGRPPSLDRY
ncbi:hypothetical protein DH2020_021559 [Rehmannia glutinosa]